jgi:hypothetical protein
MLQYGQLRGLADHSFEACESHARKIRSRTAFVFDVPEGEQATLPRPGQEHTKQTSIGQAPNSLARQNKSGAPRAKWTVVNTF